MAQFETKQASNGGTRQKARKKTHRGDISSSKPPGLKILSWCLASTSDGGAKAGSRRSPHKALVLLMTFIAYATFHMGRRPLSVVKNVLHQNCSSSSGKTVAGELLVGKLDLSSDLEITLASEPDCSSWAPFDKDDANELLARVDTAFLASYAVSMLFSGIIAERVNLRHFISFGCAISGLGLIAAGLAKTWQIHSLGYFVSVQLVSGAAQSIGWPVVVTCVSNWFLPSERGLVYGFWNSHTNLGNIAGALLAGAYVETDWGLSFIVPGMLTLLVAGLLFLFLVPGPRDVGLGELAGHLATDVEQPPVPGGGSLNGSISTISDGQTTTTDDDTDRAGDDKAVSFLKALRIPGVLEFSMCLFFSKLVCYTYLYWLPKYIASTTSNDSKQSAFKSVWFDVGGVVGGILAGYLSDKFTINGLICSTMLIFAIPSMLLYQAFGSQSNLNNILLQSLVGLLVNGPFCLITTAVSADLGDRVKSGRAVATVTAIIDATGSIGAVVGPFMAGYLSGDNNWRPVFLMLIISEALAALCLSRIVFAELKYVIFGKSVNIVSNNEG